MQRLVLAALGAAYVLSPVAATAHATLETQGVQANSTYKAVMRIPHGCEGEATHTVKVEIPEGVISVKPMPKAGWDIDLEIGPYDRAYEYYGNVLDEGVTSVTWRGGPLPDHFYDEFIFRARLTDFPIGSTVHFPTTQLCDTGSVAWVEIPAHGQDPHDLDRPAPGLRILASDGGHHGHGAVSAASAVVVTEAWSRATAPSARNGAAFMTLTNGSDKADRIVGALADIADRVELHTHIRDGDIMRMREVDGIDLPVGEAVSLQPGGLHVMFMGLKAPLKEGERFPLTLRFEHGEPVTVDVVIQGIGASGPAHGDHGGGHHHH